MTLESRLLVYKTNITVRWGDMDALGHVNSSKYFTYFEQARVLWLQQLGYPVRQIKTGPILATSSCNYLKAIVQPAEILIQVYAGVPRRSSFTMYYKITDQHDNAILYAEGESVVVWADYELGKSIPLPDDVRKHLPESK